MKLNEEILEHILSRLPSIDSMGIRTIGEALVLLAGPDTQYTIDSDVTIDASYDGALVVLTSNFHVAIGGPNTLGAGFRCLVYLDPASLSDVTLYGMAGKQLPMSPGDLVEVRVINGRVRATAIPTISLS